MLQNIKRLRKLYLSVNNLNPMQANVTKVASICTNNQKFSRGKKPDPNSLSSLFIPVPVKPNPDDINVGAELTGSLNKGDLLKVLNKFYQNKEIKQILQENGLDSKYL